MSEEEVLDEVAEDSEASDEELWTQEEEVEGKSTEEGTPEVEAEAEETEAEAEEPESEDDETDDEEQGPREDHDCVLLHPARLEEPKHSAGKTCCCTRSVNRSVDATLIKGVDHTTEAACQVPGTVDHKVYDMTVEPVDSARYRTPNRPDDPVHV